MKIEFVLAAVEFSSFGSSCRQLELAGMSQVLYCGTRKQFLRMLRHELAEMEGFGTTGTG
jgi:hypothetical protein